MENLHIDGHHGTYYVPTVDFNERTGVCSISGESYLEDTIEFYQPLFDWIDNFMKNNNKKIIFNISLTYYNTSSSKCLVDILTKLKAYKDSGNDVEVNWYYDADSEDADEEIEEVEDFMLETGLKINLIPYEKNSSAQN
jgi:hypothetical protein